MAYAVNEKGAPQLPPELSMQDLHDVLQTYNDVTQRLQHSHERLQQEVQRLHNQLEQKNRELELKNRLAALGEMAAGMAHEIRNPLGGIQLYTSTLIKDLEDRPPAVELLGKISRQVRHLNELVNGILGFTQHVRCDKCEQPLGPAVQEAVDAAAPIFEEQRIRLEVSPEVARATACVDAALFSRALLNLLLNAGQAIADARPDATRAMGRVRVQLAAAHEAGTVAVEILDDGPGVPLAALERIFHPFFTTRDSGTGLGLAIVHRIAVAHGGRISVRNRPEGGACFTFYVPAEAATVQPPQDVSITG